MKIKYNKWPWYIIAGLLSLCGCNDDDNNWQPGEMTNIVQQIYFTSEDPEKIELIPGETRSYNFTLSRADSIGDISVPLTVSGDTNLFDFPSTAEFTAGNMETQITVTFTGTDKSNAYNLNVGIQEGSYNSPYTSFSTSVTINISVAKWILFAQNVRFSETDVSYPAPLFPQTFTLDLYQIEGQEKYSFFNFMTGVNLTFTLKKCSGEENSQKGITYYMEPEGGSYGTDYYGDPAWFFDTGQGEISCPLYREGIEGYLNWGLLYVNEADQSYYSCKINFTTRTGELYGYFVQYDDNGNYTSTYPYLTFSWTETDEIQVE